MVCPNCRKKVFSLLEFMQTNPLARFECRWCRATLRMGPFAKLLIGITFLGMLASFYYTFPIIHEIVNSPSSWIARIGLKLVVPYLAIVLQAVVIFLPVSIYTWLWGDLEVVSLSGRRGFE